MALNIREFLRAHGGAKGNMVNLAQMTNKETGESFVSVQTIDGACFLAFARDQFKGQVDTVRDVKTVLLTKGDSLDVLAGQTVDGKDCYTIVNHTDLYEAFDF